MATSLHAYSLNVEYIIFEQFDTLHATKMYMVASMYASQAAVLSVGIAKRIYNYLYNIYRVEKVLGVCAYVVVDCCARIF